MATKKSTADDWNKALSTWTKKPAVTTTKTKKKTTTSTSDRLRDNDLGRTQTVATRPVSTSDRLRSGSSTPAVQTVKEKPKKKKKDSFSEALEKWKTKVVEPAVSTSDRLRGSYNAPTKPVQYETKQPQFDYGIDRVDTRPGQFTAQQQQAPTRTTTLQPYDPNTAQGPQQRPSGINAWLPKNFAFSQPLGALAAADIISDPQKRDAAGRLIGAGLGAIRDEVTDSAAYERFGQSVDQNREDFQQRSTWGDVGQAAVDFGRNLWGDVAGMGRSLAEMSIGAKTGQEVGRGALENMDLAPYFAPVGELLDLNQYTGRIKQGAMNTLAGAQLGQDYLMTGMDVPEETPIVGDAIGGLPLGPLNASLRYSGIDLLKSIPSLLPNETNTQLKAPAAEIQRLVTDWWGNFQKYTQEYRDAVQPDTFQQGLQQGPETQAMNRERSFLNWADPESVAKTYDALTNQQTMVDEYNQTAAQAWQEGALSTSEAARDELWRQAAEAGSKAWQLENTHPQELVNQNTNIVAQLIMEVLTPDVTDLLGNVFALTGMTPAARRLTKVTNQVMTPTEQVLAKLDDLVVTAENAADVAKQVSPYNARNLLSLPAWWSTGKARATMATDKMVRYTVNLLSDVETTSDAGVLLAIMATDPRRLITGIPAEMLQSPGLVARADSKGLVRFGSMGIDRITEPLRIYQQAAQNILSSPALREGPLLNKVDFINTFIDETNQAGYRFYNVAEGGADVPAAAKSGRIIGTGNKGEYVVEFVDAEKKVISQSDPMTMAEANKLKGEIGSGRAAQKSVLNEAGQFQRSIVSPFYILASPGTWATNIIGGMATALGDGDFAFVRNRTITDWIGKQYGIDPTVRGLEGVMSAASPASQFSDKGPFKFLKKLSNAYSKIDEFTGNRVFYASANKAMRQVGREVLTNAVTPLLTGAGVDARTAKRMVGHLYEAGLRGDDLVGEFNKLLNGQTKILNLAEINPTWLDAIPPDAMDSLQKIIQGATSRDGALAALRQWGEETGKHWDTLIASSPSALPRYVWQKQETFQDAAEIKQAANMATKYGEVPAEAAQSTVKTISDGMTETQRRMQTLAQIVTESADPKNRYVLYNIWGQVNDLTAGVRAQLGEMAEAANGLTGPAKNKAWQDFWSTTDRLWTERNAKVNQLLEDANTAMAAGQDFTPRLDQWKILERTASMDEAKLWETMRLDPTSGRHDPRLKQVIDAGRAITDKGWARVYAAARRFLNVDAMDYIVSAEHSIQMAGAQAGDYLELARNKARKANTDKAWSEFFQIRNEVRRQQRVYEKSVLENATYHIVSDGLGAETSTGLKFDAGPDGTVELIRPKDIETTSTDKLSKERRTKATTRTEWDVRREDGTTTTVPDNMVPAELKAKYKGVTDEAKAAEIEMELDNIASVEPYAPEAQAIIDNPNPGATAELFEANVERLASADVGFPGSRALDEAEGLRAERAAATVSGGAETRDAIRAEWDRVAKGQGGYLSIDRAIQSYTRNGVVSVPENKFEDLYGTTIAGQRIENQADVDRLLQQYYDMGQQRLQRKAAAAPANDLNALRKAAKDAGIPTLTDAGRPMDKRLINTINKDLGLKLRGLRDLTPEQYTAAMEALARRATSAPAAAPIARYAPPAEQVATVERTLQPELERVARRAGTTVDELVAQGNQALQPLLQSPVAIQVATGNIDNILSSGGLQNAFSTRKTSPGKATSLDYRASAEAKGLGIPTTAAPEEHAVYGYLLVDDYARKLVSTPQFDMGYGDISFVLKDDVRARTTFTVGDSVNQFDKSRAVGIPLDGEPSVTAWGAESPAVWGLAQNGNIQEFLDQVAYVETHTQGGVKLSDVQQVLDPNSKLTPAQVQRLEAQGIQVVQGTASTPATRTAPTAAATSLKAASIQDFGAAVNEAAGATTVNRLGDKVFINQVYETLKRQNPGLDITFDEFKTRLVDANREMIVKLGRADMGYALDQADLAASSIKHMMSEFHFIRQPEMRTLDYSVQAIDFEAIAKQLNFGGWWGKDARKTSADALRRTTEAGGAVAGDLSHGAMFAKQQLENILSYMENNIDEILKPPGKITQGQNLQAIDAFRKNVLPAWDNVKYAASEYGNRMRSFTMVDFANMTRLDEIMSLYMPYGFWMTRTAKNSLERAIFQPHIWRRVMQTEREIRSMQDQEGDPQRYEGAIPIDMGNGITQYMRILPSKYWPAAGIFTSNDYADPESANSALGYATESMRAANLASYPWWDAGAKIWENISGGEDWNKDLYPVNYTPQGRIAADFAIKMFGADAAQYMVPGYFENSVARTLNNMAVKGEITREQARWAHDYLWQLKQGGEELPEEMTGAYDPKAIEAILDKAMRATAGVDLQGALTSWATGVSVRPYDQAEGQWSGAATNYQNYKYGEENPYGSKAAADTQKPDAALAWSKAGVWRPEEQRPGVSMATDAKSAEKEALNAELMAATDEFISSFNGTPKNFEINEFKDKWMADRVGVEGEYFGDSVNQYLDEKYPSATTFTPSGGERYPGYAPEEIQIKVRTAAYYKAKEEIAPPVFPVYPGENATRAQYNTYFDAKDKYDLDKAAYDKAIVDRVAELINDPVALRQLAGLPVTNAPTSISDYLRSNSADTFNLNNALGYPMRPTGEGTFNAGMTDLAGDPETAEAIIEAEKTKYMSALEKQVRAANEAAGDSSGGRGGRSYRGRGYSNRRYSSGRRGYSRRYYGGGGGGGGTYNVPDVYGKGLSEWLNVDPERVGYQAPNQVRVNVPDIGPEAMKAWRPLSWK